MQMKATKAVLPCRVLFVILNKVALTFQSVYQIIKCDHANESHQGSTSLSGAVCHTVQGGSNFSVCV